MVNKLREKLKRHFHEVMRIKRSAHSIALGFAIGTFISIVIIPGFHILLGVLVVLLYKKVNKFSLFGAMAFWNPFTLAPVYWLGYRIGGLIFVSSPVVGYEVALLNRIYHFSVKFLVGNLTLAIVISTAAYFIVWGVVGIYRKIKSEK